LVLDALARKPRRAKTRAEEGVFVDLAVRGSDDVRVENNVAELDLAADLRVRGYLPDPTLWGRVDVLDGAVRILGRDYETMESTVEFLGETQPVPQLDLHARTQTRDYTVNVDVTGPLDNYQVGLTSVPYLTHTDIAALLTMGMTSQEMEGSGNAAGVGSASILSEGFQEEFTAVGEVFGVDLFHIDPSYSPATQTTVPRVTLGKAITEQLSARYSVAVGADTQQNVELQYTLNPRVSLLGTWIDRDNQERGSLGGEVRFRFPFR
jgi:translocation and assembly module TamB